MVDGTHTIDLVRWYAGDGPVDWVFGQIDSTDHGSAWGAPVENAALIFFRFASGVRVFMTLGHHSSPEKGLDPLWPDVPGGVYHQIILRGTKGQIEIDGDAQVEGRPWVRLVRNGAVEEIPLPQFQKGTHARVVGTMLETLGTGVPHILEASSARATLEIIIGAYESSRRRATVELPLNIPENPLFDMLDKGEV